MISAYFGENWTNRLGRVTKSRFFRKIQNCLIRRNNANLVLIWPVCSTKEFELDTLNVLFSNIETVLCLCAKFHNFPSFINFMNGKKMVVTLK